MDVTSSSSPPPSVAPTNATSLLPSPTHSSVDLGRRKTGGLNTAGMGSAKVIDYSDKLQCNRHSQQFQIANLPLPMNLINAKNEKKADVALANMVPIKQHLPMKLAKLGTAMEVGRLAKSLFKRIASNSIEKLSFVTLSTDGISRMTSISTRGSDNCFAPVIRMELLRVNSRTDQCIARSFGRGMSRNFLVLTNVLPMLCYNQPSVYGLATWSMLQGLRLYLFVSVASSCLRCEAVAVDKLYLVESFHIYILCSMLKEAQLLDFDKTYLKYKIAELRRDSHPLLQTAICEGILKINTAVSSDD
ncbi:hypothetical protein OUZ56_031228 [Daphnia magna]|uniref:Uncharacterized protein n=1 Tax=Daphnia magna TaxID=35525 RepID=A0ABQ9ZTM7_9CRUS|nr:hypothetical protein OUZ56_031228 [Daphnia magna]